MQKEFLIIDDDDLSIFLLKKKIEKLGYDYKINSVLNGKLGLEFIESYENDLQKRQEIDHISLLIFLDINMPIMNGFEFLENFKNMSEKIKIIKPAVINMFTSSNNPIDIEQAKEFSMVHDYIVKFPDGAQLKKFIERSFSF